MKNCYCVCYNTLNIFKNKDLAKRFYTECYYMSDGAERERYSNVLIDLQFGNVGRDKVDDRINEICYLDENNESIKKEKIEWTNYREIIKQLENEV